MCQILIYNIQCTYIYIKDHPRLTMEYLHSWFNTMYQVYKYDRIQTDGQTTVETSYKLFDRYRRVDRQQLKQVMNYLTDTDGWTDNS